MRCGSQPSPAQGTLCSNTAAPFLALPQSSVSFISVESVKHCAVPKDLWRTFPGPVWAAAGEGRAAVLPGPAG